LRSWLRVKLTSLTRLTSKSLALLPSLSLAFFAISCHENLPVTLTVITPLSFHQRATVWSPKKIDFAEGIYQGKLDFTPQQAILRFPEKTPLPFKFKKKLIPIRDETYQEAIFVTADDNHQPYDLDGMIDSRVIKLPEEISEIEDCFLPRTLRIGKVLPNGQRQVRYFNIDITRLVTLNLRSLPEGEVVANLIIDFSTIKKSYTFQGECLKH
jgi:hypothetical protein